MARTLWPGRNAVDQDVFIQENGSAASGSFKCKVIGVVGDVRQNQLEPEAAPQIYLPGTGNQLVVRTRQPVTSFAPALRGAVRQVGADIILEEVKALSQLVDQFISPKKLIMLMVGLFSMLALLLALVGIYGVIAYSVSRRIPEMGIRLALGSSRAGLMRLVVGKGMQLTLVGCAAGLGASMALTRVIQALLFEVSPTDSLVFAASGLVVLMVGAMACWLPARRAAGVNPMTALRCE
jgi:hypothetical protein